MILLNSIWFYSITYESIPSNMILLHSIWFYCLYLIQYDSTWFHMIHILSYDSIPFHIIFVPSYSILFYPIAYDFIPVQYDYTPFHLILLCPTWFYCIPCDSFISNMILLHHISGISLHNFSTLTCTIPLLFLIYAFFLKRETVKSYLASWLCSFFLEWATSCSAKVASWLTRKKTMLLQTSSLWIYSNRCMCECTAS